MFQSLWDLAQNCKRTSVGGFQNWRVEGAGESAYRVIVPSKMCVHMCILLVCTHILLGTITRYADSPAPSTGQFCNQPTRVRLQSCARSRRLWSKSLPHSCNIFKRFFVTLLAVWRQNKHKERSERKLTKAPFSKTFPISLLQLWESAAQSVSHSQQDCYAIW